MIPDASERVEMVDDPLGRDALAGRGDGGSFEGRIRGRAVPEVSEGNGGEGKGRAGSGGESYAWPEEDWNFGSLIVD